MALPIGYAIPCRRGARRHGRSFDVRVARMLSATTELLPTVRTGPGIPMDCAATQPNKLAFSQQSYEGPRQPPWGSFILPTRPSVSRSLYSGHVQKSVEVAGPPALTDYPHQTESRGRARHGGGARR